MSSAQTLDDADRRTVARWAAACAERVLPLFTAEIPDDERIPEAIARTRAYALGESTAAEEIRQRMIAVKAAGAATSAAGAAAARAAAQASAVAHMGAHALGAAAYAAKAVSLASPEGPDAVRNEVRWQLDQLTDAERTALRQLPAVGQSSGGPLGPGLLTSGVLGDVIREIQADIGCSWRRRRRRGVR
ncbi:hypothetical protein BHE97_01020 [Aeromicrobium sp. PE09-221]|uniref:putative immunity protein n=1 Tax=Aeromicrobium sp. PE09-221 TaxID=1898043 RepID=UPI000B3E806E|nr:hypothetical protein [Aeromicrobium sp. PE09-221]OUZ12821.1 hypothetical protein BHE97_01020 [Aeromicrobium sp. PE09-221]